MSAADTALIVLGVMLLGSFLIYRLRRRDSPDAETLRLSLVEFFNGRGHQITVRKMIVGSLGPDLLFTTKAGRRFLITVASCVFPVDVRTSAEFAEGSDIPLVLTLVGVSDELRAYARSKGVAIEDRVRSVKDVARRLGIDDRNRHESFLSRIGSLIGWPSDDFRYEKDLVSIAVQRKMELRRAAIDLLVDRYERDHLVELISKTLHDHARRLPGDHDAEDEIQARLEQLLAAPDPHRTVAAELVQYGVSEEIIGEQPQPPEPQQWNIRGVLEGASG